MSRSTISTFELFELFPDQESARVTARKRISSMQLAKEIGITQKSAWFFLGRLREACGGKLEMLRGIVEIDETFIGGDRPKRDPRRG